MAAESFEYFPNKKPQAVLDHAVFNLGMSPERLLAFFFPLWEVEVEVEVDADEEWDLIDRFLILGVGKGRLSTPEELAAFYSLDEPLVRQALGFLTSIGHLRGEGRGYELTDLGLQSMEDDRRRRAPKTDRRRLYFEAYACSPLKQAYYDSRQVAILEHAQLAEVKREVEDGPRLAACETVDALYGFDAEALSSLENRPDRKEYNIPAGVGSMKAVGSPRKVFLPAYLVRDKGERGGRIACYTRAKQGPAGYDEQLSAMLGQVDVVQVLFHNLAGASPGTATDERILKWAGKNALPGVEAGASSNGVPRAILTPEAAESVPMVGDFVLGGGMYFQVWCEDEQVRVDSLLRRASRYFAAGATAGPDRLSAWLRTLLKRLEFESWDYERVASVAENAGEGDFAAELRRCFRDAPF